MKLIKIKATLVALIMLIMPLELQSKEHPKLILTKAGVETIRKNLGQVPLFDASVASTKQQVDSEIALGIDTPIPT